MVRHSIHTSINDQPPLLNSAPYPYLQDTFYSPFSAYLNTNYIPTNIDRAQILALLREPEAEVAQLNEEIARLQAEFDVLQSEHDTLEQAIFEHYQLLSPFRRLPDDILQEIFLRCLPEKHNALMSSSEAPLLLGRVCSRWRTIAFHTPRLWATLHIPLPVPPTQSGLPYAMPTDMYHELCKEFEERFKVYCRAIHDWLTRSGSCPLSLSLNPMDMASASRGYTEYTRAYVNVLLPFSHRWRSLELTIPTGEISSIIASIPASDVPNLELLHLKFSRRSTHDNAWMKSGLLSTRSLRALQLSQFPFKLSTVEADFSRITRLILADTTSTARHRRFSIDEAYTIFTRCRSLVHCVLDVVDISDAYNLTTDMVSLPHLESLTLIDGAFRLGTLIECLDLPSLSTVTFHTTFWPSTTRRSPLVTLLSRTSGRVESLTTDVQFFTLADLVECFELVPFLTHFSMRRSRLGVSREQSRQRNSFFPSKLKVMKTVLDLFLPHSTTPDDDDRYLCPHLQILEIKDLMILTDHDVLPFLRQKMEAFRFSRPPIAQLKEVAITFTQNQELDLPSILKDYVDIEEGLKLTLKYPDPKRVTTGNFSPSNGLI